MARTPVCLRIPRSKVTLKMTLESKLHNERINLQNFRCTNCPICVKIRVFAIFCQRYQTALLWYNPEFSLRFILINSIAFFIGSAHARSHRRCSNWSVPACPKPAWKTLAPSKWDRFSNVACILFFFGFPPTTSPGRIPYYSWYVYLYPDAKSAYPKELYKVSVRLSLGRHLKNQKRWLICGVYRGVNARKTPTGLFVIEYDGLHQLGSRILCYLISSFCRRVPREGKVNRNFRNMIFFCNWNKPVRE